MAHKYREVAFTPTVRAAQERYYGHAAPAMEAAATDPLGPHERAFIAARDSFYLATVGETGWPYVQHRGGPPGFLCVLDAETIAFADYEGNRQMISTGNLAADDRVSLFLMDYARRRRLKIFGRARVEDAAQRPDLARRLTAATDGEAVARLFVVAVVSFDWNCPRHIPQRFSRAEVESITAPLQQRIAALEAALATRGSAANSLHAVAAPTAADRSSATGSSDPTGPTLKQGSEA